MSSPISRSGVDYELRCALIDAKAVCDERGALATFRVRQDESEVQRDRYGTIKQRPTFTSTAVRAYPIQYNPSRQVLERAGLFEEVDVTITTPTQSWLDASFAFEGIDIKRTTVVLQNAKYNIKEKGRMSHFEDEFLYITFGLTKQ